MTEEGAGGGVFLNWKGIWHKKHKNYVIFKLGVKINVR